MKLVIVESPYAGEVETNLAYLRAAMFDCLLRGEAPLAGHRLYTAVLDDAKGEQRHLGMEAAFAWAERADYIVAYTDRGISRGMFDGIERHQKNGKLIEYRSLPAWFLGPREPSANIVAPPRSPHD